MRKIVFEYEKVFDLYFVMEIKSRFVTKYGNLILKLL